MIVRMPVKCLDKHCLQCEDLEIKSENLAWIGSILPESGEPETLVHLYCAHYKRCAMIQNNVLKKLDDAVNERKEQIAKAQMINDIRHFEEKLKKSLEENDDANGPKQSEKTD